MLREVLCFTSPAAPGGWTQPARCLLESPCASAQPAPVKTFQPAVGRLLTVTASGDGREKGIKLQSRRALFIA